MAGRFGGGEACPACGKSVYANEEVRAAGKKWHKACFRCSKCQKGLDSTTVSDHEGKLFCRRCYAQECGIGGYGFGQGAGVLGTDGAVIAAQPGGVGMTEGRGVGCLCNKRCMRLVLMC